MKVVLVHPPVSRMIESILPREVEQSRGHNPPLGLLYVAAAIKRAGIDEVFVVDAQAEELDDGGVRDRLMSLKPDVVGITALSFTLIDSLAIARIAKELGAITILGGPHPHIYPIETSAFSEVDYIVRGEGEVAILGLLNAIREKRKPTEVAGVGWSEDGKYKTGGAVAQFLDVGDLPTPARELIDVRRYTSVLARSRFITTMMSSRGCPYNCLFCDRPHLGRKFRSRDAKAVADEIGACIEMGVGEFLFYDDNFTTNRERALAICNEIRARGYKIVFDVRARVNDLDETLLREMKLAGCDRIHLGVESGDAEILKTLRKGITREAAERGFGLARMAGIKTLAYFMFGAPGETFETAARTIAFAKKIKPDYAHFSLLIPFPATELYALGLEKGVIKRDYWAEFARSPSHDFVPPVWEEKLDRAQLVEITMSAYKKFYGDPTYILRRFLSVRSPGELWRQAKAGLRVLGIR